MSQTKRVETGDIRHSKLQEKVDALREVSARWEATPPYSVLFVEEQEICSTRTIAVVNRKQVIEKKARKSRWIGAVVLAAVGAIHASKAKQFEDKERREVLGQAALLGAGAVSIVVIPALFEDKTEHALPLGTHLGPPHIHPCGPPRPLAEAEVVVHTEGTEFRSRTDWSGRAPFDGLHPARVDRVFIDDVVVSISDAQPRKPPLK